MATPRLPTPGGDDGTWGDILNDYLGVSHNSDGTLATNSVGSTQVQAGSLPAAKLDSAAQTNLTKASTSVQQVNSSSPNGSGAVTLTAADVGAIATSAKGAANGVATLDGSSKLPVVQVPDLSGTYGPGGTAGNIGTTQGDSRYGQLPRTYSVDPLPVTLFDTFSADQAQGIPNTPQNAAYTISSSGGEGVGGAAVVGGYAVARTPISANTKNSVYASLDLGAGNTPKSFAVRAIFDTAEDSATMIARSMAEIVVGDAWLHMEFHSTAWNLTYITSPGGVVTFNPIASGVFTAPLPLSTVLTCKYTYDASTSTLLIQLPGASSLVFGPTATGKGYGSVVQVTDAHIAANIGRYVAVEPVSRCNSDGTNYHTTTRYKAWSVGIDGGDYPTPLVSPKDLVTAISSFAVAQPKQLVLTTGDKTYQTTTPVLTTISELQHTVDLLGQLYQVDGEIIYDAGTAVGMTFALSVVTGAVQWGYWTVAALGSAESTVDDKSNHWMKLFGTTLSVGSAGAGVFLRARISGVFLSNATTVGFLVPQVEQKTGSALAPLLVRNGSRLTLTPLVNIAV